MPRGPPNVIHCPVKNCKNRFVGHGAIGRLSKHLSKDHPNFKRKVRKPKGQTDLNGKSILGQTPLPFVPDIDRKTLDIAVLLVKLLQK